MLCRLNLIFFLGRGDIGIDELSDFYAELRGASSDRDNTVSQMVSKATLADYLSDGLDELRKHKMNVNKLSFTHGKVQTT